MPRIPTVISEVDARAARPGGALDTSHATPEAMGAGIGRGMQAFAAGVDQLGAGLADLADKRKRETVANTVAQADFTPTALAARNEVPADGSGLYEKVGQKYDAWVAATVDKIEDPSARVATRERLMADKNRWMSSTAQYQFGIAAENSKLQANTSLDTLRNKVMSDPTQFDAYIEQGKAVLDTRTDMTAAARETIKTTWAQQMANARFVGMLQKAKTVADVDAIAAELTGTGAQALPPDERKDWTKAFAPEDYRRFIEHMATARTHIETKADTDARAAIDTVEQRAKDAVLIPPDELTSVQSIVRQSKNPITLQRMARIMRDQDVIRESRNLPPNELRGRIAATQGGPGMSFPNLPPELNRAVNDASTRFGVSAAYLGGTIYREYGANIPSRRAVGDPKFVPTALRSDVDLRNVNPAVVDAATVAGQVFGRPLPITSGYRSQERQDEIRFSGDPNRATVAKHSQHTEANALDISTVGMTPEDKGRLVGALADAGFTGFGEYDTHIHADFRSAVPSSFAVADGQSWGGWTNLSPEVAKALTDRGFSAGLSADAIKRGAPVASAVAPIDYGKGTGITGADGKPTTTAQGVMQFPNGPWLELLKAPGNADKLGVKLDGMTDQQILDLRKDPYVSTMAGALVAGQNRRILESSLGRTVSDGELYMAHFLGATGALAVFSAMKSSPDKSAAEVLPNAAASNKPVFYDKSGRALTVKELYGRITTSFAAEPTQVAYGDNVTRQKVLDDMEKGIKNDPMSYAQKSGTYTFGAIQAPEDFVARARDAKSVADYYSIPQSSMKPFTEDEANALVKRMKDGTVDDVLSIMSGIQSMGGDIAKGALKQIDEKDKVYAYAAGLMVDRGAAGVASDIVRGQKRIEENPAIKDTVGAAQRDVADAFNKVTGGSLMEIAPDQRQAIQDAAFAHYIETSYARGASTGFDKSAFETSIQAVMGGSKNAPAIDKVNGAPVVLPAGLSGSDLETAFKRMTVDDWSRMSVQGLPPRYITGDVIQPKDLVDEAVLRAIGNGKYKVMLSDGTYAITGRQADNGRIEAYIFSPNEKDIKSVIGRPTAATPASAVPPVSAVPPALDPQRGALWNFDENGRWLGPVKGQQK